MLLFRQESAHARDLDLHDLAQLVDAQAPEQDDLVHAVQELGPEAQPQRGQHGFSISS
jgi:hypothetical protein